MWRRKGDVSIMEIWDDPTLCCDYKSRCRIPLIKEFLEDLTTRYDNNIYWTLNEIIKKWSTRLKDNEEDDK